MKVERGVVMFDRTRRAVVLVSLLGLVGARAELDAGGQSQIVHLLHIVASQSAVGQTQADAIVPKMGDILQNVNGPGDIPCNVAFVYDDMLTSTSTNAIRTETDVKNLARELDRFYPAFRQGTMNVIVVVERINWCTSANPAGCTYKFNDDSFGLSVVERTATNPAIVWAHEFGHMQGLHHRSEFDRYAVMNKRVVAVSRQVNEEECNGYKMQ